MESNKTALAANLSATPSPKLTEVPHTPETSSTPHTNGTTRVYGPELPPSYEKCNGAVVSNGSAATTSSSDSDNECDNCTSTLPPQKPAIKFHSQIQSPIVSTSSADVGPNKLQPTPKHFLAMPKVYTAESSKFQAPSTSSTPTKIEKLTSTSNSPTAKLVPYDVDDSSSASEDSVKAGSSDKQQTVVELKTSTGKDLLGNSYLYILLQIKTILQLGKCRSYRYFSVRSTNFFQNFS